MGRGMASLPDEACSGGAGIHFLANGLRLVEAGFGRLPGEVALEDPGQLQSPGSQYEPGTSSGMNSMKFP